MIKRALIFSIVFTLIVIIALFYIFDSFAVRDIAKRFIVTQSYYQLGLKVNVDDVRFSYFRPAVRVKNLTLEKADGDVKVKLSAPEATVRFKPLQLIRGSFKLKGLILDSPKLELEFEKDDTKETPLDYKKYYSQFMKADINIIEISKANIAVRMNYRSGKPATDVSFKDLDLKIKKAVLSDYKVTASSSDMSIPFKQLHSFEIEAHVKGNDLRIDALRASVDGGNILVSGSVSKIDDIIKSDMDLSWKVGFSLPSIIKYDEYIKDKDLYEFKGTFFGQGKIKYDISEGLKSVSGSSSIRMNDFVWDTISVPRVDVISSFDREKIFISKIDVSDGLKSVSVHGTTLGLRAPYPIKGQGSVNNIELSHYLEMFGLKNCLSFIHIKGPFSFVGNVTPEFNISSMFDLKTENMWVLYEKGLKPNKEGSVLNFKNGIAKGMVHFNAKGAHFDKFIGKSENNEMLVDGWIYADSTVDLDVSSSAFSIDTYGRIGELPLKGKGSFETKLIVDQNGDFKTRGSINFSEVELLNKYVLGKVDSKVVYDGDTLSFKDVKGKVGGSNYSGAIDIDLGKKIMLRGKGEFKDTYSNDIYKLFKYDQALLGNPSGIVSGNVKFEGAPTWPGIKMDAKIKMRDVEFFSERFDELSAGFLWNKGNLSISELYVTKGKGRFDFKGGRKGESFKLDVSSKNLDVSDLVLISKQGVYVDGNVDIKGSLEHKNDKFSGLLNINMLDLIMGDKKLRPVFLNLSVGDQISLKYRLFDKEVEGELKRDSDKTFVLKAKLKDFNFYPVGSILIPDMEEFSTAIDGDIYFRFSMETGIKSAVVDLSNFTLNGASFNLKNKGNVYVEYNGAGYSIRPFAILSESENLKCVMNFNNEGKRITAKGCMNAVALKILKKYVASSRGKVEADLYLDTKLNGSLYVRELELLSSQHKLGTMNMSGRINIANNIASMEKVNIAASGGNVGVTGNVDLTSLVNLKTAYPVAKLKMNIDKLYFEYPEGLKGKWSGDLELKGSNRPYSLSGNLVLHEASYRKDFDLKSFNLSDSKKVNYGRRAKPFLNLNVKTKTSSEIYVKNSIFVGDLVFDLNAVGSELEPKLIGSIDLIRGDINYMDNTFELTSGRIRFRDDDVEPFVYQLDSEIKTGSYQVFLKLVSRKGEPVFKLTSVPSLTEDKIIALLATGDTQTDFSEKSGGYGATAGAGGQIVTEGLGVTGALKNSTGVGVKLKAPKAKESTVPDIELQKDLTNDIRLIYGKSLDEKANKQEVNVQYDINRNVQLKLLLEEEKKDDANKVPANNAGVDVKFRFEF